MPSKRIQKAKKNKEKEIKKEVAITKNLHKFEQEKRVFNMNRDKERYALVEFENNPKKTSFVLINMKDMKKLTISVKSKSEVSCSCMDWKIRGKKNQLNCKHILYVVSQILKHDFQITSKNQIKNWNLFQSGFDRIKINFKNGTLNLVEGIQIPEDKVLTEEDVCPICFTDFMTDPKDVLANCQRCRGIVHIDCFKVWLQNSISKCCVYCRDTALGKLVVPF